MGRDYRYKNKVIFLLSSAVSYQGLSELRGSPSDCNYFQGDACVHPLSAHALFITVTVGGSSSGDFHPHSTYHHIPVNKSWGGANSQLPLQGLVFEILSLLRVFFYSITK